MIKYTTLFAALMLLVLQSCKKENVVISENKIADSTTAVRDTAEVADSAIAGAPVLETFAMPPEVEGCSCYFAENRENYEKERYLYVDDYGNSAYLKMNGKMIKIQMDEGDFDPSNFSKTIENAEYKVSMTGKKLSELDETMMFRGQMTVVDKKSGEKITTPVYGECGC
ncbi:MAG: hypothetical protein K0M63_08720 [Weeksellaceae bacterium]|nr:hypothetical protein [Weeksellaceae bacterium]